ncbi:MAG: phosphodiester glycosidase family protein, partial [Lentisphaerae bacterium]|nr:phosphodiester glycosidase family protein [Lentisphaerota bacterium]
GYASGEEALAHVGLGGRDEVDVEIRWNGQTRVLPRQSVNRMLVVEWKEEAVNSDAIVPGPLRVDNPTIHHLAFRWPVSGDQNVNATVRVSYRKQGQKPWNTALPMLRISKQTTAEGGVTGDLFAGSVLNLEPATAYEVRFELNDPDGGQAVSNVTVATRAEPAENRPGKRRAHVYPAGYTGARQEPAFPDLQTAFAKAQAGDVVVLHAGKYAGPFRVSAGGTEADPIIFRAAGDGEVILDGGGQNDKSVIEVEPGCHHLGFERLSVRGGRVGIRGTQTDGLVVRRCMISDVLYGVSTGTAKGQFPCNNWYVADNILTGRYTQWKKRTQDHFGAGINIAGRGHVACYNRVRLFWDGISTAHVKLPVPLSWATDTDGAQNAIDIYNNDISETVDDAIEADYGICNIRVMRNRITDSLVGISIQPCLAGPIYVTHNVAYRFTQCPWKLYVGPTGVMLFHNTTMAAIWRSLCSADTRISNSTLRNNLFLGGREGAHLNVADTRTSLDFDGYDAGIVYNGKSYRTPKELADAAGQESHGRVVGADSLVNPATFDADRDYSGAQVDLRLKPGSPAVDAGKILPTINDGFAGKAPDLGAYEMEQPLPRYGPRPATQKADAFLAGFGLEYRLKELSVPRPNRAHILRVDTSKGRIEPAVVVAPDPDGAGPAEAALTNPLTLATGRQTLAFINTNPWDSFPDATGEKNRNWFEGQAVDINGLAVSAGIERSPKGTECVPVRMTSKGKVAIGEEGADATVGEGMAGWQQIVKEGKIVAPPSHALAPRTALGINRDSNVLWLVVIDGRQNRYSEGMSWREVAEFMLELGCWSAANMDGGGSSVMGLAESDEHLRIVNSPSDRAMGLPVVRPLPMILTIRKAAAGDGVRSGH